MRLTIRAELVAKHEDLYTQYVFKNLDETVNPWYKYLLVTKCPNWQGVPKINKGDIGYLEFEAVLSGDIYTTSFGEQDMYKYSNMYFINFIKEKQEDSNKKEFKF